jgi:hypothetical protein
MAKEIDTHTIREIFCHLKRFSLSPHSSHIYWFLTWRTFGPEPSSHRSPRLVGRGSVASMDDTSGLSAPTSNNPICICRASPTVEVTTPNELPVRLALGKDDPVEHVEHFLAEIEPKIFGKMEALGKPEVLVENRECSSKAGIQCCQNVVIPTFAGVPRISVTETAFGNRRGFCR